MDDSGDARLLASLRGGNQAAWEETVERWAGPLFDHLLQLTNDPATAERLAVEAFVLAADSLGNVGAGGTVRAHLFGAAWHTLLRSGRATPDLQHRALLDLLVRQGLEEHELAQALRLHGASAGILASRLAAEAGALNAEPGAMPAPRPARLVVTILRATSPLRAVPVPPAPARPRPAPPRERGTAPLLLPVLVAVVVALAAIFLVPASPFALIGGDGSKPAAVVTLPTATRTGLAGTVAPTAPPSPTRTRTPRPSATASGTPAATGTSTVSPTRAVTTTSTPAVSTPATAVSPTAANTPTPTPGTVQPTVTPTPVQTATPTPCAPLLSVEVGQKGVTVLPSVGSFFYLFNSSFCGSANFSLEVIGGPWLQALPPSGNIAAAGSAQISLLADPPAAPGTYTAIVRITGPANTIDVPVSVERK